MSDPRTPAPCECGFYSHERHHSRTGGGACPHYSAYVEIKHHEEAHAAATCLLESDEPMRSMLERVERISNDF